MPAPETVRAAYAHTEGLVRTVGEVVSSTMREYCKRNDYLFFDRVKELDSLSEKLEGGRIPSWSEIDDLYACTIIVPVASHEPRVIRKLDACFSRKVVRSHETTQKAPDVFRFDATRYYARLTPEQSSVRPPGVGEIIFEVQILTAFEYAWTRVTHDLIYKADVIDWRRLRLAAQLKASIEQMEATIGAFEHTAAAVSESSWDEIDSKTKVIQQFKELIQDRVIAEELAPDSWRRFAENVYSLVKSYSKNRYAISRDLEELMLEISVQLRRSGGPAPPISGTLFQLVVAHVSRPDHVGSIDKFRVVDSPELKSLHGVAVVPLAFEFDSPGFAGPD